MALVKLISIEIRAEIKQTSMSALTLYFKSENEIFVTWILHSKFVNFTLVNHTKCTIHKNEFDNCSMVEMKQDTYVEMQAFSNASADIKMSFSSTFEYFLVLNASFSMIIVLYLFKNWRYLTSCPKTATTYKPRIYSI